MILGTGLYIKPAYQKLNYIQSTGTQCINPNINLSAQVKVCAEFAFTTTSSPGSIAGGYDGSFNSNAISTYNGYISTHVINAVTSPVAVDANNIHIAIWDGPNVSFTVDGNTKSIGGTPSGQSSISQYLLAGNYSGSLTNGAKAKLYSAQYYVGGILVRDFVPVKRNSDDAIGLYDKVNKVFYGNAGTGTFLYG